MLDKSGRKAVLFVWVVCLSLAVGVACSAAEDTPADDDEMEHEMEHEDDEMEHDMEHVEDEHDHAGMERIPNDGATIQITAPEDGAVIQGEEFEVSIDVQNFALDDDGSHWHVYVDGTSWGMVIGGDTSYVLHGVEPGEHVVETYLALGTHEELEQGDTINITVEE